MCDDATYLFTHHLSLAQNKVLMKHNNNDPDDNRKVFYDKFVDNKYVTKKYVGRTITSIMFMLMISNLKTIQKLYSSHRVYGNEYSAFML